MVDKAQASKSSEVQSRGGGSMETHYFKSSVEFVIMIISFPVVLFPLGILSESRLSDSLL